MSSQTRVLGFEISGDARKLYSTLSGVSNAVWQVGKYTAAIGAAGFAGWVYAVKQAAAFGDAVAKAADRTGLTTDEVQALKHAAQLSGASLENVEAAMKGVANAMFEGEDGSMAQAAAFGRLGVSSEALKKASPKERFDMTAEALAGVADAQTRAALAQDVFGKGGLKLLPMLTGGVKAYRELTGEAARMGIVMSGDQVRAAVELSDKWERLGAAMSGAVRTGVAGSFDDLARVMDRLMAPEVLAGFQRGVAGASEALVPLLDRVAKFATNEEQMKSLAAVFEGLAATIGAAADAAGVLMQAFAGLQTYYKGAANLAMGAVFAPATALQGQAISEGEVAAGRAMLEELRRTNAILAGRLPAGAAGTDVGGF